MVSGQNKSRRWVITGSRGLDSSSVVGSCLDGARARYGTPSVVLVGDARGADACALAWCLERDIAVCVVCAQWDRWGLLQVRDATRKWF